MQPLRLRRKRLPAEWLMATDSEQQQSWIASAPAYSYIGEIVDVKEEWPSLSCRYNSAVLLEVFGTGTGPWLLPSQQVSRVFQPCFFLASLVKTQQHVVRHAPGCPGGG